MNRDQLEAAIAAQESLRGVVSDEVIDATIETLRQQLSTLDRADERRQVTVLFADVSGFTALSELRDHEDVSTLMNRVWSRLDNVITDHGGRIDKHIGDALMAIWGADTTREDDPELAVRAALELQRAMDRLRSDEASELHLRVGVNTGPVLLGRVGSTGEFTAIGDTVNLASRLEHAAPTDGVLIAHETYRHVKGVFSVAVQAPLEVKGKRAPVRSYRVDAVRPRAFRLGTRGVEGVETRMVGRDAELERLRTLLRETALDGLARSVTVVGEAGLGKSRLLYEFEDWLRLQPDDVRLLTARADERHSGQARFLLRDLLFTRFEITSDDPPATAAAKFERGVRELAPETTADDIGLMAALVGIDPAVPSPTADDVAISAEQAELAFSAFLRRVALDMPIVILLEDLHWADDASLDTLDLVLERCDDVPIFTIGLARPALFERRATAIHPRSERIELQPLSGDASRRLVREILQRLPDVPAPVVERLAATGAGNPFFVEELVKVLVDDDAIRTGPDGWTIHAERLERNSPPSTITGVLQARLDRLPPQERLVLERAAVVGRTFWPAAIPLEGQEIDATALDRLLAALTAKELVFERQSSGFADASEYIFKHALLHDVAVDRTLKRDRADLHRQVARWYANRRESRGLAATIADHLDRAGDTDEAARWHLRAGQEATRRFAPGDALRHLDIARAAVDLDASTRMAMLLDLGEVHTVLGLHADALMVADELLSLAQASRDRSSEVAALIERSFCLGRLGRLEDALDACDEAVALLDDTPDAGPNRVRALAERGWILQRLGRTEAAVESGLWALSSAVESTPWRDLRRAHSQLGVAYQDIGDGVAAAEHLEAALRLDRAHRHSYGEAADLINLGMLAMNQGHLDRATTHTEEALRITREVGDRDQEGLALNNLGDLQLTLGHHEDAERRLEDALQLFVAAGAAEHTSETRSLLARARWALGDPEGAHAEARVALELAERTGSIEQHGNAWLTIGAIALFDGEGDHDALEHLRRGATMLRSAGLEPALSHALGQLADIAVHLDEPAIAEHLRRVS